MRTGITFHMSAAHTALAVALFASTLAHGAEVFRVATYNLQNYLETAAGTRPAKTDAARKKIRESIRATKADVIALQEMGSTNALLELREGLRSEGLDFHYWEHVSAWD